MLFRSDRKSTRLNSSHTIISYAVFCLKKKTPTTYRHCQMRAHTDASSNTSAPARAQAQVRVGVPVELSQRVARWGGVLAFFFLMIGGPRNFPPFPSPPLSG